MPLIPRLFVFASFVVLVAGVFHIVLARLLAVIFIDGKLDPPVIVDTVLLRRVRFAEIAGIDSLVERRLHAPSHVAHLAAVYRYQHTVVVCVQLVQPFLAEYHVALVAGPAFVFLLVGAYLHYDVIDASQGDVIGIIGIAFGVVIVGIAVGIAQMHRERHVGVDRAVSDLVGQRARHLHVGGVCRSVGEIAVLELLSRFVGERAAGGVIALLAQGVPLCVRQSVAGNRLRGRFAVLRHVEHESATVQQVVRIACLDLERHFVGIEIGTPFTVGVVRFLGQQQRLGGNLHHPPAAGAEVEAFPLFLSLPVFVGDFGLHHELHLGVRPFGAQRAFQRGSAALRAGYVDDGVCLIGVVVIVGEARHHELCGAFHGLLVQCHDIGFEFVQRSYLFHLLLSNLIVGVYALGGEVGDTDDLHIVQRSGGEADLPFASACISVVCYIVIRVESLVVYLTVRIEDEHI